MGSGNSHYKIGFNGKGTSGARDDGYRVVKGQTTKINADKQAKHIPGCKNYLKGRSIFQGSIADAQDLVTLYAGTGTWINSKRERIDFGKPIGKYKAGPNDPGSTTTIGIIMYSKTGTHIVPARPKEQ